MVNLEAKCEKFPECKFAQEYIRDNKSPWYIKFCNSNFKACRRHIYCCNKFNTKGKSLPVNYAPTGSLL